MSARKFKNIEWDLASDEGSITSWDHVKIAVLMDIRDELKEANAYLRTIASVISCNRFIAIPSAIDKIVKNTARKRRPQKKAS